MNKQSEKVKMALTKEISPPSAKEEPRGTSEDILSIENEITSHRGENRINIIIGLNIKRIRICKGWSQEKLSEKSGISRQIISRIENGKEKSFINVGRLIDFWGYPYLEYIRTDTVCRNCEGRYIINHEKMNDSYMTKRLMQYMDMVRDVMVDMTKPIE